MRQAFRPGCDTRCIVAARSYNDNNRTDGDNGRVRSREHNNNHGRLPRDRQHYDANLAR